MQQQGARRGALFGARYRGSSKARSNSLAIRYRGVPADPVADYGAGFRHHNVMPQNWSPFDDFRNEPLIVVFGGCS